MQKSYSSDWSLYNNPAHTENGMGGRFNAILKCYSKINVLLTNYNFSNHGFSGLTVSNADSK